MSFNLTVLLKVLSWVDAIRATWVGPLSFHGLSQVPCMIRSALCCAFYGFLNYVVLLLSVVLSLYWHCSTFWAHRWVHLLLSDSCWSSLKYICLNACLKWTRWRLISGIRVVPGKKIIKWGSRSDARCVGLLPDIVYCSVLTKESKKRANYTTAQNEQRDERKGGQSVAGYELGQPGMLIQ